MLLLNISGGRKLNVESRLRLTKEDTSLYYLFKLIKDRVSTVSVSECHIWQVNLLSFCLVFPFFRPWDEKESLIWKRTGRRHLAIVILLSVMLSWICHKAAFPPKNVAAFLKYKLLCFSMILYRKCKVEEELWWDFLQMQTSTCLNLNCAIVIMYWSISNKYEAIILNNATEIYKNQRFIYSSNYVFKSFFHVIRFH